MTHGMRKLAESNVHGFTLMLALLDFTLSSRQFLHQTVVFLTASVTVRVLFPLYHVLWLVAEGKLVAEAAIFYGWMG